MVVGHREVVVLAEADDEVFLRDDDLLLVQERAQGEGGAHDRRESAAGGEGFGIDTPAL
jgi:hypothetical protein